MIKAPAWSVDLRIFNIWSSSPFSLGFPFAHGQFEFKNILIPFHDYKDSDDEVPMKNTYPKEVIHAILLSNDIIQLRKEDFNIQYFKLQHLNIQLKQQMAKLLEDYAIVFLKSLKAIGHTDLITPEIVY